jgi:hypothetical protein
MTWSRRNILKLMPGMAAWPALSFKARSLGSVDPGIVLPGAAPGPVPAGSNQRRGQTYSKLGYKVYILDFQFADLDPDTLKNADVNKYADAMVEMGVETLLVYANNVYGINFFKSQYGPKFKNITDDFLGEFLNACRQRKIKTTLYHAVYWQEYLAVQHPDWAVLQADGKPAFFGGAGVEGGVTFLCLNSPFRELYMKQVKEIADRYTFDSWFVDEYFFHWGSCVCYNPYCLAKYKARTGEDLPRPLPTEKYPQYLDFTIDTYRGFYQEIRDTLKASGRDVLTTHNCGLDYSNDDYLIMESITAGFDFYGTSLRTKLYRARARGRELQMIPHRGNGGGGEGYTDGTNLPQAHLNWQTALITSHNSAVMWADQAMVDGAIDPVAIRSVKEAFKIADLIIPKVKGTVPYAEIALFSHERDQHLSYYHDYADLAGANKLLTDLHWPFDVITEESLNPKDLSPYRVLVVPNIQYLSADYGRKILDFVEGGGTLFCCGKCAVFDDNGKPAAAPNFGLVRTQETNEPRAYIKPRFPIDDERLKAMNILIVEPDPRHEVLGTYVSPTVITSPDSRFKDAAYPGRLTDTPVIVRGSKGKGWYVYAGCRFFHEYLKQNLPIFGQALTQMLAKLYRPSVWVEAPTVVEAVYNQLGSELRISLINGSTSRPAGGGMYQDADQRAHINVVEVIPISDVKILLRGKRVRRATDLAGRVLRVVAEKDRTVVMVPRLKQYDVITLELA